MFGKSNRSRKTLLPLALAASGVLVLAAACGGGTDGGSTDAAQEGNSTGPITYVQGKDNSGIVQPAIDALRAEGLQVSGPHPPDTLFTPGARAGYDVAICLYHDQALIPLKTLDMASGVNVTLGLPLVRTSPDHGTAFDIAGTGRADPASLLAALRLAARLDPPA